MTSSKDQNRLDFPHTAKFMDEWRKIFGEGIWVRHTSENGKQAGKKDVREFVPINLDKPIEIKRGKR